MISIPRIGMGLLDSLSKPLCWILLYIWTWTVEGETPDEYNTRKKNILSINLSYKNTDCDSTDKAEMGNQKEEKRPDKINFTTIDDGDDDDEGDADHHGRPFTISFLKRAAKESDDVNEFLESLDTFKESEP